MSKKLNKKGFTLIEVVLVLAIGGLIFLLAFIAFQQVSRNRRDTQRRADASRIVAELANYKADKNNNLPSSSTNTGTAGCSGTPTAGTFEDFVKSYMCKDGKFSGPDGEYDIVDATAFLTSTQANKLMYTKDMTCSASAPSSATQGKVRVQIRLENGYVCKDDN